MAVAFGLVVAGCADGDAPNDDGAVSASPAATTITASASTTAPAPSAAPALSAVAEPPVSVGASGGAGAAGATEVVNEPPGVEQATEPPGVGQEDGGNDPGQYVDPNPYDCVGDICPNPYPDAPQPDPNADPANPQIVWCGTDKNVHNRGATVYDDGSWSPWTQACADEFDAVNDPPNPPGTMGGGGAVAGPCRPDEEGTITHTPDMRKQQCTGGHWVYIR
ncbi:hypothetical protein ACFWPA_03040 [Rhodococcus sp. NPDC058505]|uniref:hypothetical protein n=1 Tax=Rhodococcus sp. NPDC058505 TaxID=3346531 RepID=UPI003657564B